MMQQRKKIIAITLFAVSMPIITFATTPIIEHDERKGEITVWAADKSYSITLQDKNLWATEVWNGHTDTQNVASYGYYYQRGNNHGFSPSEEITVSENQVDTSWYGPNNPYNSDTFIIHNSNDWFFDWSSVQNDNLRWWSWDNENNNYWYDQIKHVVTNVELRQGPCDIWYHVPSKGELEALNILRWDMEIWDFLKALKIPAAGNRNYSMVHQIISNGYGYYQTSSPSNTNNSWFLLVRFTSQYQAFDLFDHDRSYGDSVRCFKNSFKNFPIIEHDEKNGEITVLAVDKSYSITLQDENYCENNYDENTETLTRREKIWNRLFD